MPSDPRSLDPNQLFSNEEGTLAGLIFNPLLDTTPDGEFVPVLTEALPEVSKDALTYVFRLRRETRFSNGEFMTVDDVIYSFERLFDPLVNPNPAPFGCIRGGLAFAEARQKELAAQGTSHPTNRWIEPLTVAGLEAVDRHTLRMRLDRPDLSLLKLLTKQSIIPRISAARPASGARTRPVGTGPFLLTQWTRGARIRLVRNPYYFRADQPGPDEVDVLIGVDHATQAMMFERGELDCLSTLPDPDFIRFRRDSILQPSLRIVRGTTAAFVSLNCELPPFTNRLVRLGLNHAVDREHLTRLLSSRCGPARGPVAESIRGFNQDLPEYAYDPSRARGLLTQAGFTNGFDSTLWVLREQSRDMKMALYLQQCLKDIGCRLALKEVSFPALWDAIGRRRTVPMALFSWQPDFDDPKNPLDLFNADNIRDEGSGNAQFYANPRVQQLLHEADVEQNPARRANLYRQVERQVVEDVPMIFLVQLNTEVAVQPWIKGFVPNRFWPAVRLENCWIER